MIISFALSIINLIASAFFIRSLPDIVPTHFDADFAVDAIGSKNLAWVLAFLPVLISLGILLELRLRKKDYPNRKGLQLTMLITVLYMICMNWFLLFSMQGEAVIGAKSEAMTHLAWIPFLGAGLLFICMGNFLPTVTQNRTLGIKLSWTLNNEQCWKLTHRFGGKVFVLAGLLLTVICLAGMVIGAPTWILTVALLVILTAVLTIVSVYAYQHRND